MNKNRLSGLFIGITFVIWILIFALSPQPKYQDFSKIEIPSIPPSTIILDNLPVIKPYKLKNDNLKINIKDNIPSARAEVEQQDLSLYVYKVGAFSAVQTTAKLIKSYNDNGFPAFTQANKSNSKLNNVLVGPFVSKSDIEGNVIKLNSIANIANGEVLTWTP